MGPLPLSWVSRAESAKLPWEDRLTGRRWHSCSRGWDRSRWHQSPSPQCPSWHQSPSPSPPTILSCRWAAQPLPWRSPPTTKTPQIPEQGATRWCPHTHQGETMKEEAGQVWYGWGVGWWSYIAPGPDPLPRVGHGQKARWCSKPLDPSAHGFHIAASQQRPQAPSCLHGRSPGKGPCQTCHWSIDIPIKAKRGTRSTDHPCWWVQAEMYRIGGHPHWWKEIRGSRRISMGGHIMREYFTKTEALHYTQWQIAAFSLPIAQHEATGWWDAPHWLSGLCPQDFMPHTNASGTKDFQTMRQQKTLTLAHALQACTESSGALTGIYVIQWENSKDAWPPWCASVDMK